MTTTYGGWIRPQAGTGTRQEVIRSLSWVSAATLATAIATGTGGELRLDFLNTRLAHPYAAPADFSLGAPLRTSIDDLAQIRRYFTPAISDLASALGVTRQSVYNWLKGEPIAPENAIKLRDLAEAADVLSYAGVVVNAALMKRKIIHGKSLFEAAQSGGSAREAASVLVDIFKREAHQRNQMASRFTGRIRSAATADFDLPALSDPR